MADGFGRDMDTLPDLPDEKNRRTNSVGTKGI